MVQCSSFRSSAFASDSLVTFLSDKTTTGHLNWTRRWNMSKTLFHRVFTYRTSFTGFLSGSVCSCHFSSSPQAIGLWEEWPTSRLAALTPLEMAVFVTLSMPIADVTERCSLCAKQPMSVHPLPEPHSRMFYAPSCTAAKILSEIRHSAATWNKRNHAVD